MQAVDSMMVAQLSPSLSRLRSDLREFRFQLVVIFPVVANKRMTPVLFLLFHFSFLDQAAHLGLLSMSRSAGCRRRPPNLRCLGPTNMRPKVVG